MLRINRVSKSFGLNPIFHDVTFSVQAGERVGLVGPNGSGKTTLLRIITGEEKADSGTVQWTPADMRVGYLAQGLAFAPGETLEQYIRRREGDVPALSARLGELAEALARQPDQPRLQQEYDGVLAQLALADENAGRAPAVLAGLGLGDLPPDLAVQSLSGGQKTRLALAGVLLSAPQALLLDEPTNHLDLEMLDWLETWLSGYNGLVLVVSHDRAFLDRVATGIVDLDPITQTARYYAGSYSAYLEQKLAERERQRQAYQDQQDEIARLQSAAAHVRGIAKFRKGGKADTGDKFAKGFFANRGLETVRRAKQMEARIERLMNEDAIDKPARTWQMKMEFGEIPSSGRQVLSLDNLSVGYGENVLLAGLNLAIRYGERVALVGSNGSGKTTLLRTIAGRIPALAGEARLGSGVRLGYMAQEQENLDPALNVVETLSNVLGKSETDVRAFLHKFLFSGDDVFTPVGSLSYGERSRMSLAILVAEGCNFLLLDEPVNHLDIPSRARFEQALEAFEGTCLAVVHDRYFIESYATVLWEVKDAEIRVERMEGLE